MMSYDLDEIVIPKVEGIYTLPALLDYLEAKYSQQKLSHLILGEEFFPTWTTRINEGL